MILGTAGVGEEISISLLADASPPWNGAEK